jgi:hypothetical protein
MTRTAFLTLAGLIALTIGLIAAAAPAFLLTVMKGAIATPAAEVMARANAALQAMPLPIDPLAYATGAFSTLGSFLPNLLMHSTLCLGFLLCLRQMPRSA